MIAARQLSKTYHAGALSHAALDDVTLDIAAGQCIGIVGRSGSGKSTLLNLLAGIDRPTTGTLTIGDTDVAALRAAALPGWRGRTVGIVFQAFQLLPTLTAAENVMLPMDFAGALPSRDRHARALDLLDRVGLAAHANKLPATLSGGEQQRVAIARALANDPPLVLADEPTGNLDVTTGSAVAQLLVEVARSGKTVVIVTHDRDVAARADRVITLVDGRVSS